MRLLITALVVLFISNLTLGQICPLVNKGLNKVVCYYEGRVSVDKLYVCGCTHLVYTGKLDVDNLNDIPKVLLEKQPTMKFILRISDKETDLEKRLESVTNHGIEIHNAHNELDRKKVLNNIENARKLVGPKGTLMVSLPASSELLAKYYDMKELNKNVDLFVLETHNLEDARNVTFHPSRLSGLWDMMNIDSIIDLVTGLGVPTQKIIVLSPTAARLFTLGNSVLNTPGSPITGKPEKLSQEDICKMLKEGNWTLERDQDLTSPYTFQDTNWLAFEDAQSLDVKSKYIRVRGLAGHGLVYLDDDSVTSCEGRLLENVVDSFSRQVRAPRQALLGSLRNEILSVPQPNFWADTVQLSPFRITRVVDADGVVHAVREDTRTEFECTRQGYFVHPRTCNRFYRCVKFDQLSEDYTVFEFDCPTGLEFDSRYEVCVWPGSIDAGQACSGSSEIAPVPKSRFVCPQHQGYYADPENCRWFFACLDHGKHELTAYEFRCPFGLGFDETQLKCDWPWLIPGCGDVGKYEASVFNHGHGHEAVILNGPSAFIGSTADSINVAGYASLLSGAKYNNLVGIQTLEGRHRITDGQFSAAQDEYYTDGNDQHGGDQQYIYTSNSVRNQAPTTYAQFYNGTNAVNGLSHHNMNDENIYSYGYPDYTRGSGADYPYYSRPNVETGNEQYESAGKSYSEINVGGVDYNNNYENIYKESPPIQSSPDFYKVSSTTQSTLDSINTGFNPYHDFDAVKGGNLNFIPVRPPVHNINLQQYYVQPQKFNYNQYYPQTEQISVGAINQEVIGKTQTVNVGELHQLQNLAHQTILDQLSSYNTKTLLNSPESTHIPNHVNSIHYQQPLNYHQVNPQYINLYSQKIQPSSSINQHSFVNVPPSSSTPRTIDLSSGSTGSWNVNSQWGVERLNNPVEHVTPTVPLFIPSSTVANSWGVENHHVTQKVPVPIPSVADASSQNGELWNTNAQWNVQQTLIDSVPHVTQQPDQQIVSVVTPKLPVAIPSGSYTSSRASDSWNTNSQWDIQQPIITPVEQITPKPDLQFVSFATPKPNSQVVSVATPKPHLQFVGVTIPKPDLQIVSFATPKPNSQFVSVATPMPDFQFVSVTTPKPDLQFVRVVTPKVPIRTEKLPVVNNDIYINSGSSGLQNINSQWVAEDQYLNPKVPLIASNVANTSPGVSGSWNINPQWKVQKTLIEPVYHVTPKTDQQIISIVPPPVPIISPTYTNSDTGKIWNTNTQWNVHKTVVGSTPKPDQQIFSVVTPKVPVDIPYNYDIGSKFSESWNINTQNSGYNQHNIPKAPVVFSNEYDTSSGVSGLWNKNVQWDVQKTINEPVKQIPLNPELQIVSVAPVKVPIVTEKLPVVNPNGIGINSGSWNINAQWGEENQYTTPKASLWNTDTQWGVQKIIEPVKPTTPQLGHQIISVVTPKVIPNNGIDINSGSSGSWNIHTQWGTENQHRTPKMPVAIPNRIYTSSGSDGPWNTNAQWNIEKTIIQPVKCITPKPDVQIISEFTPKRITEKLPVVIPNGIDIASGPSGSWNINTQWGGENQYTTPIAPVALSSIADTSSGFSGSLNTNTEWNVQNTRTEPVKYVTPKPDFQFVRVVTPKVPVVTEKIPIVISNGIDINTVSRGDTNAQWSIEKPHAITNRPLVISSERDTNSGASASWNLNKPWGLEAQRINPKESGVFNGGESYDPGYSWNPQWSDKKERVTLNVPTTIVSSRTNPGSESKGLWNINTQWTVGDNYNKNIKDAQDDVRNIYVNTNQGNVARKSQYGNYVGFDSIVEIDKTTKSPINSFDKVYKQNKQMKDVVAIVTKLNDYNPFVVSKLGAQCSCKTGKFKQRAKFNPSHAEEAYEYEQGPDNYEDISYTEEEEYADRGDINKVSIIRKPKVTISSTFSPIIVEDIDEEEDISENPTIKRAKAIKLSEKEFKRPAKQNVIVREESTKGTECKREGLFRHPKNCNKFYSCSWDSFKKKYVLHEFKCPIQLSFDDTMGACNWPSQGPACQGNTLLPSRY